MSNSVLAKTLIVLRVTIAHYKKAPLQAGAILIGIVLAVTLVTGVRAINENAKKSYRESSELLGQRADWFVVPVAGKKFLSESVYFELRKAGVDQSLPVVEGILSTEDRVRWQIQGSDILAVLTVPMVDKEDKTPSPFDSQIPINRMLLGDPVALISEEVTSDELDDFSLTFAESELEVIPLADSFNLGKKIFMDISLAQKLLQAEGQLSYIALFNIDKNDTEYIRKILEGKALLNMAENGDSLDALTESFHLNLTAMSLLAFIVGLFIAYNGIRYSLLKRQRLFTQIQQLGVDKTAILGALITELSVLVVIGSVFGFILGVQLSYWLLPMVSVTLEQLYDATILPGVWYWSWLGQAIALTLVSALFASSSLFYQLYKHPLAKHSGQFNQQYHSYTVHKIQIGVAVILAIVASIFIAVSDNYKVTMGLMGVLILAIPLSLPWLLQFLINAVFVLAKKLKIKGMLYYQIAETKELVGPLSLAMMAMLLAVTANVSMNTLVGSFESTLSNWLNARLHADLYVRPAESKMLATEQYLLKQESVQKVYKQFFYKTKYQNFPVYLVTKDKETLEQTTIFKTRQNDVWRNFYQGNVVMLSEPMAVRLDIEQGQTIELEAIPGRSFSVGGVFYDYGNPYGEVLIPPTIWKEMQFSSIPVSLGIRTSEEISDIRQSLIEELKIPTTRIFDQQQIKQYAIEIFNKTFAITKVLNSLTLLVAAIGLFSACLMLTQARTAAVARLYSLGVSQTKLTTLVISQMLTIVLITCLIALPAGFILGYVLINNVTLQAFGWSIAFVWDWAAYLDVVMFALIASSIAVTLPLYRLTRRPLVSSLQSEVI